MENTYRHAQLPEGRVPALRVEPMPADTNQSGEVFGGWVMSQVDLAGANTAMRYALSRYIVTRAVSSLTFEAPVLVGDVVSFYTDIIKVGRTSVTVKVEVYILRTVSRGKPGISGVKFHRIESIGFAGGFKGVFLVLNL